MPIGEPIQPHTRCSGNTWFPGAWFLFKPEGRCIASSSRPSRLLERGKPCFSSWRTGSTPAPRLARPKSRRCFATRRRNSVAEHFDTYDKGDVLVEQGQPIGEEQLILLRMEHEAATSFLTIGDDLQRTSGVLALVASLFLLSGYFVYSHERRIAGDLGHITTICGLVLLCMTVVRLLATQTWNAESSPWRSRR